MTRPCLIAGLGATVLHRPAQFGTPKAVRALPMLRKRPNLLVGRQGTRTLDPLIKSTNQRVQADHTDELSAQQLDLWPDLE